LKKKINFILLVLLISLFFTSHSKANFKEELINKYKSINTLYFDFTQKIGDKVEFGNCNIKYPLLMKCEYPKKKKSIISNGKRFVVIKKRYKKIYSYPLKKTPLFFLLKKENILNVIENYEPTITNFVEYNLKDENSNSLKIFFDKNSLEPLGWKTIDAYSNEVTFLIRNIETNVIINNELFKIPKEEDL
tara:strand:- start:426 stop:995 length:570 start_codon:yes stop_codon:yes gene_type:complete